MLKRWLQLALAVALGLGWALPVLGQNECAGLGDPVSQFDFRDSGGILHRNLCRNSGNGLYSWPALLTGTFTNNFTASGAATIGLLNGKITIDGTKIPQTEAGFNQAVSLVLPSGSIEIPPNVMIPVVNGIVINKPITVICSQNQLNDNAPSNPGGFSGTGITIVQMNAAASGGKIQGCTIQDLTGSASTVGLFLGPDLVNFTVDSMNFQGNLGSLLGTAMKWTHAIKGRVLNSNFQGWNEDIECNNNGIGAKSNANHLVGNQIRTANFGIQLNADCTDDIVYMGGSNEHNGVGINAGVFTVQSFIQVVGVDFENNVGAQTNINLGTGNLGIASGFNHYAGAAANKDIIIGAGNAAESVSAFDELNEGITHNGTGAVGIYSTALSGLPSITGTGCVIDFRTHGSAGQGIVGTNCTGSNYVMSGFSSFDVRSPINDLGGVQNTRIGAATGKGVALVDHTQSAIDIWAETTGIQTFDAKLTTAGNGHGIEIYNTAPAASAASVPATTMFTPGSTGNYRFSYYLTQTVVGASCAGNTTVQVAVVYKDPSAAGAQTVNLGLHTVTTNGTIGVVPWTSGPTTWTLRSTATAIQFQTTFTPGGSCSPAPTVQIIPVLEAL